MCVFWLSCATAVWERVARNSAVPVLSPTRCQVLLCFGFDQSFHLYDIHNSKRHVRRRSLYPVPDAEVTSSNVHKLLVLADKRNVPMLLRKCEQHLLTEVIPKLAALGPPATKKYGQPLEDVTAQGGAIK